MLIKYIEQATVRILEPHQWDAENGYTVDVLDPNEALHLLTHPPGDFKIAPAEPLLALDGMTEARAGELVLHGITTIGALGALSASEAASLAEAMGVSADEMRAWENAAKEFTAQAFERARQATAPLDTASEAVPAAAEPATPVEMVALESERAGDSGAEETQNLASLPRV
jgi:predicted flap endonuclease-1-like 5' DNA nuclease